MLQINRIVLYVSFILALSACGDKKLASGNSCFIDLVNQSSNQMAVVKNSEEMIIAGWVADDLSKTTPTEVTINFVSTTGEVYEFSKGKVQVPRPDVAAALGLPSNSIAGFGLTGKVPKEMNRGIYNIQTVGYYPNKMVACKTEKNIEIQ